MNSIIRIAPVHKDILVQAPAGRAFEIFTAEIDRWWPKTHGIGEARLRRSVIEPFVGGRWFSICEDESEVTIGHMLAWEPGRLLAFTWEISAQWKPDPRRSAASEVEIRFQPQGGATRVEVEHRNFERMGLPGGEIMRAGVEEGWPGLLQLYAAAAAVAK